MAIGGKIKLEEGTGHGTMVGFKAPDTEVIDECIWTLPSTDGIDGQALVTDGAKNLSFASAGLTPVELVATWGSIGASAAWLVAGFDSRTHCGTVIGIKKDTVEWATPIQAISFSGYLPGSGIQGSMQIVPYEDWGLGIDFTKHYANFQSTIFLVKRDDTWSSGSPADGDTVKLVVLVTPIS